MSGSSSGAKNSSCEPVSVYPEMFKGFDFVPAPAKGPLPGRGVEMTESPRGIRGHPYWEVVAFPSVSDPGSVIIDPTNLNFPMLTAKYLKTLWPRGGVYAPRLPGGGGARLHTAEPVNISKVKSLSAIVLSDRPSSINRVTAAIASATGILQTRNADEIMLAVSHVERISAIYIDMYHPRSRQTLTELHGKGIPDSVPVFPMLKGKDQMEDVVFSREAGAFLPVSELHDATTILVYLEEAVTRWDLFLARHGFSEPQYSGRPQQHTGDHAPERTGWLGKLFNRNRSDVK